MAPVTVEMTDFIDEETNPDALPHDPVSDALKTVLSDLPSPCSRRAYAVDWNRFSEWLAGQHIDPLAVTPKVVTQHVVWMRDEKGYKRSTMSKALSSIREVYKALVNAEVIAVNPARETKTPRSDGTLKTPVLTQEQMRTLLASLPCDTWREKRDRMVLLCLFGLGWRRAEIARMRTEHFDGNVVTATVKRNKQLTVAVPDWLMAEIGHWRAAACIFRGPLFPREQLGETSISGPIVYEIVIAAAKRAGFPKGAVTPHAFRRTFVTLSGELGVSLKARQLAVGHDSSNVTERYDHARDARRAAPGNAFAEIVGAA
jgi:site-specific recombinase XerD